VTSTYISQIIEQVNQVTCNCGPVLLYGENIDNGSKIAGLARGLQVNPRGKILNVGNSELTHCGVGLGMMLDGGNSVLFMKQLDFLLLGLDQIVNTYNFARAYRPIDKLGSFTVFPIVCDQGYQGPQSSLNSAGDVASLSNIAVYCLNACEDAAAVISEAFVAPGLRIICTSQRLFGMPSLSLPILDRAADSSIFRFRAGNDVTIVCFNFALRLGLQLSEQLQSSGLSADLFHANFVPGMDCRMVIESCRRSGRLIVLDDSKTITKYGDLIVRELQARGIHTSVRMATRSGCAVEGYGVGSDEFQVNFADLARFSRSPRAAETRVDG